MIPKNYMLPICQKIYKFSHKAIENIEYVQSQVAEFFGITVDELIGKCRRTEFMMPRHTSIALCDALLPHSMVFIAKNHGGRDHATGIHSVKVAEDIAFTNPIYRRQFTELRRNLEAHYGIN